MRALIVEDHQILSRNLQQFLQLKDIESVIKSDGKEALYTASTEFFDVIILDINLPSMEGDEICKRLREKGKDTPILMLTSRSTKSDLIS
jgi:DNA-binding response OmpR family regulator